MNRYIINNQSQAEIGIKIFLFLFEICWKIKFHIVGEISLSEIILFVWAPFNLKQYLFADNDMAKLLKLYAALFATQIVSEVFVSNGLSSSLKGLSITIVSFLHTVFLFKYLSWDKSLILVLLFGRIAGRVIFGQDLDSDVDLISAMNGDNAVILKFYYASIIRDSMLAFSLFYSRRATCFLFVFIGFAMIVAGARCSGFLIAVVGIVVYAINNIKMTKFGVITASLSLCILGYALYAFYVSMVLSGELFAGNNSQLLDCDNPYNPLELLARGRSEFFVGLVAFSDEPLFGHGAWAEDYSLVYVNMIAELHAQDALHLLRDNFWIPVHSVLVGHGVWNGIFAFLVSMILFIFFVKRGFKSLAKIELKYQFVLVSSVFGTIWNYLFSAPSGFRLSLPFSFAIIMALWLDKRRDVLIQKM